MKISFSWLKDYIQLSKECPSRVAQLLTQSGLEVAAITEFELIKGGLKDLVIGQVIACQAHPNADSLKVTQVDVGRDNPLFIVCGAPNVAVGQKVVVAPVGAHLYNSQGDCLKIKKTKIRGEVSEGMICAEDEIGLGSAHEGILVLNTALAPGTPAVRHFDHCVDTVLEIDITPNRGDACSHIGTARELGALLDLPVQYPAVDDFSVDESGLMPVQVNVSDVEACPRYTAAVIKGVKVSPSPAWMQARLKAIGITPTNNIVDVTNFVMHELGQPLHAFDYNQIDGETVTVQCLKSGTEFVTLDGKTRVLNGEELMICDQSGGICMAGVLGGQRSSVHAGTEAIFLESAYFNPSVIRKAAKHHDIRTDASFRYERGVDPNLALYALHRACALIQQTAGGVVTAAPIDLYPNPIEACSIPISYQKIEQVAGVAIPKNTIKGILTRLDIAVTREEKQNFVALVPPYRADVRREADLIEEILRIYGYDRIPVSGHLSSNYLAKSNPSVGDKIQSKIADILVVEGYHEINTNSITDKAYVDLTDALEVQRSISIINPLSEILNAMRQTLLFSGLEVVKHNVNRKQSDLKLFEFGTTYCRVEGVKQYQESSRLGIWLTGHVETINWRRKPSLATFQDLNAIIHKVLGKLGITAATYNPITHALYDECVQITNGEVTLLTAGNVSQALLQHFDIRQPVFFADVEWKALLDAQKQLYKYQPLSKFPPVRRDLSLVLDKKVPFEALKRVVAQQKNKLIQDVNVFDVYEGQNLPADKKAYALSFVLQGHNKTLDEKVIDKTMMRLRRAFEEQLGATIRV